ncbi:hypothetical protein HJC23_013520 [Cyclotella cryptica]|uniref:Phospholipid/glycerol acyltransferase domain-containing protein n=1 Tax=Cyclotella cryptica TaxID=29204 RepID=A0ABD3NY33_9STRA|eukprot:CCRYP_019211-RB/>CCRYP_019211-RB protein AED:0.09 eAED:0.09 QI:797/1/1/1/0.66/0.5/4/226/458
MMLFHFTPFLVSMALYSAPKSSTVVGFEISNLAKINRGVIDNMNNRRSISALFASLHDGPKQAKHHVTDIQQTDEQESHDPHLQQHQQQSLYNTIQRQRTDIENHNQHQLQHHRRIDVQQYNQKQSPLVMSLHKENKDAPHSHLVIDHLAHPTSPLIDHQVQIHEERLLQQDRQEFKEEKSHVLTLEEISPIYQFTNKKGHLKVVNLYGLYNLFIILITMPFWLLSMEVLQRLGDAIEGFDDDRSKFDYSGKIWCRTYLRLVDSYPEIAGDVSRLKDKTEGGYGGACLFVANHASFLDIAVLCTVLDPVFKFIAKDSLAKFPGVGKQLVAGEHVLIDRTDKRSQLRSFKQAISYLQNGIPIMAFPEGARSPDGRLMAFKPGLFSMAVKAKVPIVPLSIANTHAVMPSLGLLSVQSGRGKLRVYVHDPIEVDGKSEEEISSEVRKALLSELPRDQQPLE